MNLSSKPSVLFVVGQTASGKTSASLAIVDALNRCGRAAEIVNADSRQVYRGMSIGTAKPTSDELSHAPHHLIGIVDPIDGFSLATFLLLARASIKDILARGATPIVVGGTGQYAWGLAEGWQAPEVPPNAAIRARLGAEAAEFGDRVLYQRLQKADPEGAALIDSRNIRRLVRALEVIEVTGKPFSEQRTKETPEFTPRMLALAFSRSDLYSRIDARVEAMLAAGWVHEVELLLAAGNTPDLSAFSSAGYREIAQHLSGDITMEEATTKAKTATHRLARAQANWFPATEDRVSWFSAQHDLVVEAVRASCP